MTVSPNVLTSPRLKVERAYCHIDELINLTTPLSRDLHTVRVEKNVGPPHDIMPYGLVYRPTKPIPETMALIIGDAVHNLRGALDHLATGIVRSVDAMAEIHFPMRKTREDFVAHPVIKRIEKALPGAARLLANEVRPEDAANDPLWGFHVLDNDDKHNLLIPTVAVTRIENINCVVGTQRVADAAIGGNAAEPIYLVAANTPFTVDQNFKTMTNIRFGPGKVFDGEPAIPTLTQLAQLVSETLDAFERLIRA